MANFNSSKFSGSQGVMGPGFQGRPDINVYRQGVKDSQNMFSTSDGVLRLRKGIELSNNSAPFNSNLTASTGVVRTVPFYFRAGAAISEQTGQYFLDFCKDPNTGKFNVVYIRKEGYDYDPDGYFDTTTPGGSGVGVYTIISGDANGGVQLDALPPNEILKTGVYARYDSTGAGDYVVVRVKSYNVSLSTFQVVKANGEPFVGDFPISAIVGNRYIPDGAIISTPIETFFDFAETETGILTVDGATFSEFLKNPSTGLFEVYPNVSGLTGTPYPPSPPVDRPTSIIIYQDRVILSGFKEYPSFVSMSRSPNTTSGAKRYKDFTTGTNPDDAINIYLSPEGLPYIKHIRWATNTSKAVILGADSGVLEITSTGPAISPSDIQVGVFSLKNPSETKAVAFDNYVDWVSVTGKTLLESSFSFDFDSDISYDLSVLTSIRSSIKQLVSFTGKEEGILACTEDNDLLLILRSSERGASFFPLAFFMNEVTEFLEADINLYSYTSEEGNIIGFNLAYTSGYGVVLEVNIDKYMEYDFFYLRNSFFPFKKKSNKDVTSFSNGIKFNMLDRSVQHYQTANELTGSLSVRPSLNQSYDITVFVDSGTASLFTDKDLLIPELGIALKYAAAYQTNAYYANYYDPTMAYSEDEIQVDFNGERLKEIFISFESYAVSNNSLFSNVVSLIADGEVTEEEIGNGRIEETTGGFGHYEVTLDRPTFFASIGYRYKGLVTLLPLSTSGQGQLGVNRPKGIYELEYNLLHSGDGKVYINGIAPEVMEFDDEWFFDWKPYYNGPFKIRPQASWDGKTEITFYQDEPQPLNIGLLDIYQETSNE